MYVQRENKLLMEEVQMMNLTTSLLKIRIINLSKMKRCIHRPHIKKSRVTNPLPI